MATRPASFPVWATAPGNVVTPSGGKQTDGWQNNERPPAKFFNWLHNLAYQWLVWLDQQEQANTPQVATLTGLTTVYKAQRDFVQATTSRDKISFAVAPTAIATGGNLTTPAHVVVGAAGNWSVSRDLCRNWSSAATAGASGFLAVAYSNTLQTFTAVGASGTIYESDTGVTAWTARTAAGSFSGNFNDIHFLPAGSIMVAVGENGTTPTIQTSPSPGWTSRTVPSGTTALQKLYYDSNTSTLVAVGAATADGRVISSTDGITWTTKATITGAGKLIDIKWSDALSLWFACSTTQIYHSPDLITWTSVGMGGFPSGDALTGLIALDECVVAFKHNTAHTGYNCTCYVTSDGSHWYHHPGFGGNGNNVRPTKIHIADTFAYSDAKRSYALWIANVLDTSFSISTWKAVNGLL